MKIKIDNKILKELSDTDVKVLSNDLLDIGDWILKAIEGKVNKCKKRFIQEWYPRLMKDPNVDNIPANEEDFIELVISRPNYKNRKQRDKESEEKLKET